MNIRTIYHIVFTLGMLVVLGLASDLNAQTRLVIDPVSAPNPGASILEARLVKKDIVLEEGEIVSNVLAVRNPQFKERTFRVEVTHPSSWQKMGNTDRFYTLAPGDSAFIPIRLIPAKDAVGAQVVIHALVFTDENQQVAQDYFYVKSDKKVSWEISPVPGRKVYFKNNENSRNFAADISNLGAYDQDIFVDLETIGYGVVISDTSGNEIEPQKTMALEGSSDTTLHWNVNLEPEGRNFRSVSILTHNPDAHLEDKSYSVFVNTSEPLTDDSSNFFTSTRIDFIRLPNEMRAQQAEGANIPLAIEAYYQNVLGNQSVMTLNLNGLKTIDGESYLTYFSQLSFRDVYAQGLFAQTPWYVGYFGKKLSVEAGVINGQIAGINAAGRGIRSSYRITDEHNVGAFYVRSPYLVNPYSQSFGVFWDWRKPSFGRLITRYGRNYNTLLNTVTDVVSADANLRLSKNHFVSLNGAYSYRQDSANPDSTFNVGGYMAGLNYSSNYFDRKLKVGLGGRYISRNFGNTNLERVIGNARIGYRFNSKSELIYSSNYFRYSGYTLFGALTESATDLEQMINNLIVSTPVQGGSIQPGLFYNVSKRLDWLVHYRGVSLRYATSSFENNSFGTVSIRAGYNNALHIEGLRDYFSFNVNAMARVRTWSFNAAYQYGAFSATALDYQTEQSIVPQLARISILNQHLFRNTHFVAENSVSYSYNNQFFTHNFGLYPRMYYFTSTGWRFGAEVGYSVGSNNYESAYQNYNLPAIILEDEATGAQANHNITIGASIRKELSIPIPFVKSGIANVPFQTFYDLNGNGQKDQGEPAIENVVINMDGYEIMTNERGEAVMRNFPHGTYPVDIFPLENMKGWFPNVEDSLDIMYSNIQPIPFVRGVKVEGSVFINRQQIAVTSDKKLDLADIRISATTPDGTRIWQTLTSVDGSFSFFLPNGDYTLSMDEHILGARFRLAQNNIPLNLQQGIETIHTSFYITEKERKVNLKKFGKKKTIVGSTITEEESSEESEEEPVIDYFQEYLDSESEDNEPEETQDNSDQE